LNIVDELSHLGGVLSQLMRSEEPGFAEQRDTINRKTSCIIKLHANQHDTTMQEVVNAWRFIVHFLSFSGKKDVICGAFHWP